MKRIRFEYHRPGKDTIVYDEMLVLDRPDVKVLLQERYSASDITVADSVILEHGAPIVWFVFVGSWHDVGRFHLADGSFTGWYTNLSKPVRFEDDRWIGNDLFLDLWQPAQGPPVWLDVREFEDAVRSGLLDAATRTRVFNERALITRQVGRRAWPPSIAKDIDLAQVTFLCESG